MRKFIRRHMLGFCTHAYGFDCEPLPGSFIIGKHVSRLGNVWHGKQRVILIERRA